MKTDKNILVMAGAREAHDVIASLVEQGLPVIASLPEAERSFDPLPVPTRIDAFRSPKELERWMAEHSVTHVIDASHPFDYDISALAHEVCRKRGLPYLRVLRRPWRETARDIWINVSSVREAASVVPEAARVFSNTGWQTLPDYAEFRGQRLYMRQVHPSTDAPPFPFMKFVQGTPPFSMAEEERLFRSLKISHLICRNVGGTASVSKVLAARVLQLPVIMIARPPLPDDLPVVQTAAAAVEWVLRE